jgi:hypothetical protein
MIEREQVLEEIDNLSAVLKRLKGRLSSETCNPPAVVTAQAVTTLASTTSRLNKLDQLVRDVTEKKKG